MLDLVAGLRAPIIVVLHTVLHSPSWRQQAIIEELSAAAERVVVQSETARTRLLELYDVPAEHVAVVPHGASRNPSAHVVRDPGRRPMILTWGLLGPARGSSTRSRRSRSCATSTRAPVRRARPDASEHVASGEAYRESLQRRACRRGVEDLVEFDDGYRETERARRDPQSGRRAAPVPLATRSSRACWSRRSPRQSRSSRRAFPHASSCSLRGRGSSFRTRTRARSHARSALSHRPTPCDGALPVARRRPSAALGKRRKRYRHSELSRGLARGGELTARARSRTSPR